MGRRYRHSLSGLAWLSLPIDGSECEPLEYRCRERVRGPRVSCVSEECVREKGGGECGCVCTWSTRLYGVTITTCCILLEF